jgi:16S rRNA (guanine527-N7)-methyltransferase
VTAGDIQSEVVSAALEPLSDDEAAKFETYLNLLLKWNAKLNLTAVREPAAIVRRHFLECIQCARIIPDVATLLDFGSGAGLPGIPIAILRPEIAVTLGESQAKKASFLREAVRTLELKAEVYDGRIESMPSEKQFEAVTLRAVDKMAEACLVASARLSPEGTMVVFGTPSTERVIRGATAPVLWRKSDPLAGSATAFLMIGVREG